MSTEYTAGAVPFVAVAVLFAVLIPVLAGVLSASPLITSGPLNVTQATIGTTVASSWGLMSVAIILVAITGVLGAIFVFRYQTSEG